MNLHTAGHRRGVVAAPHHAAAEAGRAIFAEGGNALEAMVAMAASIAAVYPHMNHIGGDGFWLVREPSVPLIAMDFSFKGGANQDPAGKPGVSYMTAATLDGYRYLARARFFNSAATADAGSLGVVEAAAATMRPFDSQLHEFIAAEFKRITGYPPAPRFMYRSTIANEDALVSLLIGELNARGASKFGSRIVLLSEWDSMYAQAFVDRLRGMVRFDGIEPLLATMADDVRRTRELLTP